MAYVTGKTNVLQSAIKAAAELTSAEVAAGITGPSQEEVQARFNQLRGPLFEELAAQVDADNALFAANDSGSSKGGGSKRSSGGKGSAGGGEPTLDEAKDMVLNFGAFKTVTLGEVLGLTAEQAADYGYGEGDKDGRAYITWLANNKDPKAGFAAKRAKVIIDALRAESDAA